PADQDGMVARPEPSGRTRYVTRPRDTPAQKAGTQMRPVSATDAADAADAAGAAESGRTVTGIRCLVTTFPSSRVLKYQWSDGVKQFDTEIGYSVGVGSRSTRIAHGDPKKARCICSKPGSGYVGPPASGRTVMPGPRPEK